MTGSLLCAATLAGEEAKVPCAPITVKRVGLRSPEGKQVEIHGAVNYDKAEGGSGQMMYPAVGGLAGLLVGIATHAAMSSGLQSAEKQKLRESRRTPSCCRTRTCWPPTCRSNCRRRPCRS
ncbi:hypothetical protein LP419_22895 [Massilia sp. H-1]|nr:hypothetical protein LP419_22895 [Massilia sp. H-1]